ncbi:DMT family transporter [Rhizobium sp. FY34]|uniref:DMT family transporter n=1 Tax=Rhizobium sp. FY34 TaxID=2562309 RepID=UPI001FEF6AE2|nr:DMT family transporter [Rhizobium sp. FY34]
MQRQMTAIEWLMLAMLSLLWGGSFLFNGLLVQVWPPLTIVAARVFVAALALWGAVRLFGHAVPRSREVWLAFLGMGLLNNVIPFTLIVWGQTHIASGLAAILNATTPLFGVIAAHFLTSDERLTANRLAGVVIGILGVAWMIGPSVLGHVGDALWGELAVLGAAFTYAFSGLYGRRFKRMGLPPILPAAGQVTASTVLLVPIALMVDRPWTLPAPGLETWAALLGLALLSTAVAYLLFFRILASAGATNLMLVTILIPPSAILLSALVLGEQLEWRHLVGLVLIGAGLAAIDGRLWRRALGRHRA